MTWNHRFVRFKNDRENFDPSIDGEYRYELCEVYYNKAKKPYAYCSATPLWAESPEGCKELASWIAKAAEDPILDVSEICAKSDWEKGIQKYTSKLRRKKRLYPPAQKMEED